MFGITNLFMISLLISCMYPVHAQYYNNRNRPVPYKAQKIHLNEFPNHDITVIELTEPLSNQPVFSSNNNKKNNWQTIEIVSDSVQKPAALPSYCNGLFEYKFSNGIYYATIALYGIEDPLVHLDVILVLSSNLPTVSTSSLNSRLMLLSFFFAKSLKKVLQISVLII